MIYVNVVNFNEFIHPLSSKHSGSTYLQHGLFHYSCVIAKTILYCYTISIKHFEVNKHSIAIMNGFPYVEFVFVIIARKFKCAVTFIIRKSIGPNGKTI